MGASEGEGWAKTVFWPTAVAMAFLKSRFLLRFELATNGRGGMSEEEDDAWDVVVRKGDGEGTAGGGMEDVLGITADLLGVEEDAASDGVARGGTGVCPEALSSLRAAFFLRRRTLRSCVADRPSPGGTGGWSGILCMEGMIQVALSAI